VTCMTPADRDEFASFAAAIAPRLRRTAYLMCGNWHSAEDLTQTTLTKLFASWNRISRHDNLGGYATRTLLNAYLAERRRRPWSELPTADLPERAARTDSPEQRMDIMTALAELPPRARAVVVLRYWSDQSIEQVADLLGCSPGNVKSQSARALQRLRLLLGEELAEPDPDANEHSDATTGVGHD
jgi:RNA polymerase sigma-70 factor (sigma-E family)